MSRRDQIADALGISPGDADQLRSLLTEFDVRDIASVLAANLNGVPPTALDDLTDVATAGGTEGDVLTQQNDGSFALQPVGAATPIESPLDIAGCVGWWDASQLEEVSDGDPVTTWPDLSGSGYDGIADTDEEPTYKTNIQNGLPVLRFDAAVPTYFDVPTGLGIYRDVPGATMACAALNDVSGASSSNAVFWSSDGDGGGIIRCSLFVGSANGSNDDAVDGGVAPSVSGTPGADNIFTAQVAAFDFTTQTTPVGRFVTSQDGQGTGSDATELSPGNTPDNDSDNVCLGATTIEHAGLTGDIGEIVCYDRYLTADEQQQLLAYLTAKWVTFP